jgi:hypothetical protein
MTQIHGNGIAPFRFLTPLPHRPSLAHKRRAVGGENRLKAERARFLTEEVRRAKPETEQFLTRWGKSGVFSESTVLSFLKHTRWPISSASLGGQHRCGETMLGGSKGVCPLGRRTQVREGEAASVRKEASVGRGKAERFPLQGGSVRLNLQGRFFHSRVFYPYYLEENLFCKPGEFAFLVGS